MLISNAMVYRRERLTPDVASGRAAAQYKDISLAGWISRLLLELVAARLKIDENLIAQVPKEEAMIVPI